MTDPERPTDAELEAGHAKLLAADYKVTVSVSVALPASSAALMSDGEAAAAWTSLQARYSAAR